jgi:hypothetical protein
VGGPAARNYVLAVTPSTVPFFVLIPSLSPTSRRLPRQVIRRFGSLVGVRTRSRASLAVCGPSAVEQDSMEAVAVIDFLLTKIP